MARSLLRKPTRSRTMKRTKKIEWIPAILLSLSIAITATYAVAELGAAVVPGHVPGHSGHAQVERCGRRLRANARAAQARCVPAASGRGVALKLRAAQRAGPVFRG